LSDADEEIATRWHLIPIGLAGEHVTSIGGLTASGVRDDRSTAHGTAPRNGGRKTNIHRSGNSSLRRRGRRRDAAEGSPVRSVGPLPAVSLHVPAAGFRGGHLQSTVLGDDRLPL